METRGMYNKRIINFRKYIVEKNLEHIRQTFEYQRIGKKKIKDRNKAVK